MSAPFHWDPRALAVVERLERAGFETALVGGCVRDSLLGRPLHDYDAATAALPQQTMAACAPLRCIPTGEQHGTVTVLSDGLPVEVTTFRREGSYADHRHPDQVTFTTSLEEDLARRDFTVNAMAWTPSGLRDPFGGREDLERRLVRCVGDPRRRFEEDALRILRGLRLAAQLDFTIHPDTAAAIRETTPLLAHVAWERIGAEFLRLLCGPGAGRILLEYPETVCQVVPELAPAVGFDQRSPHHCFDVYTHCVKTLEGVSPRPALRLAALLHDVGKPACFSLDEQGVGHFYNHPQESARQTGDILRRLRLDNAARERVETLVLRHSLPVEVTPRWVGRWLRRLGPEVFLDLMELESADRLACAPIHAGEEDVPRQAARLAREILAQAPCLTLKDLAVNGRDAMAAGLKGPEIGRALNHLLDLVAQGDLPNQRDILLKHLKQE